MREELQAHIDLLTARNIKAGMSPDDARYSAHRAFGRVEQVTESCREERGVPWLEHLVQDMTYGWRLLRKNRSFTLVTVLTLALGIGATTAVFSIIRGVLLKPLDFPGSERIVHVWEANSKLGIERSNTSPANFYDWRRENTAFEALACSAEHNGNITRSFVSLPFSVPR